MALPYAIGVMLNFVWKEVKKDSKFSQNWVYQSISLNFHYWLLGACALKELP